MKLARREMQAQFCNLKQLAKTVDTYAAEFIRLSRLASAMVADKEDRVNRFLQGLTWDLQKKLTPVEMATYDQVLKAARRSESLLERRNNEKMNQAGNDKCRRIIQEIKRMLSVSSTKGQRAAVFLRRLDICEVNADWSWACA